MNRQTIVIDDKKNFYFCLGRDCKEDCAGETLNPFYTKVYYIGSEAEEKMRCPMSYNGISIKTVLQTSY